MQVCVLVSASNPPGTARFGWHVNAAPRRHATAAARALEAARAPRVRAVVRASVRADLALVVGRAHHARARARTAESARAAPRRAAAAAAPTNVAAVIGAIIFIRARIHFLFTLFECGLFFGAGVRVRVRAPIRHIRTRDGATDIFLGQSDHDGFHMIELFSPCI